MALGIADQQTRLPTPPVAHDDQLLRIRRRFRDLRVVALHARRSGSDGAVDGPIANALRGRAHRFAERRVARHDPPSAAAAGGLHHAVAGRRFPPQVVVRRSIRAGGGRWHLGDGRRVRHAGDGLWGEMEREEVGGRGGGIGGDDDWLRSDGCG